MDKDIIKLPGDTIIDNHAVELMFGAAVVLVGWGVSKFLSNSKADISDISIQVNAADIAMKSAMDKFKK